MADRSNNRIQIFDPAGRFLTQWTNFGTPWGLFIKDDRIYVVDGTANNCLLIASIKDGKISKGELERMKDAGTPEQKETAKFFLDDPKRWDAVGRVIGGKDDGVVSHNDIQAALINAKPAADEKDKPAIDAATTLQQ